VHAPPVVDAPDEELDDALVNGAGLLASLLPPEQPVSAMSATAVLPMSRFTLAPWSYV